MLGKGAVGNTVASGKQMHWIFFHAYLECQVIW